MLVKVLAERAKRSEAALTAAINALKALISVYPDIASDAPSLLKVVGPLAVIATAQDLKLAGFSCSSK